MNLSGYILYLGNTCRHESGTILMRVMIFSTLLILMLALPAGAQTGKGYLGFAHKSDTGGASGAACRSFGGQLVLDEHYGVVMRMGRRDAKCANVIYHGGHQYVTFSIETASFWGRRDTVIALCHFAG